MASDINSNASGQKLGALLRSGDPRAARLLGARGGKASHGGPQGTANNAEENEANS